MGKKIAKVKLVIRHWFIEIASLMFFNWSVAFSFNDFADSSLSNEIFIEF